MYAYIHHTHFYNWSTPSCYSSTAALNDFYRDLMPYAALANSYLVSFHDAYQCQAHTHKDNGYSCHISSVELV